MKLLLLLIITLCFLVPAGAQVTSPVVWQVNSFDMNVNVPSAERAITVVATINATNIGSGSGRTLSVRLNSKASVKSVAVGGAATTFRQGAERDLQRIEIALPSAVGPSGTVSATVNYTFPVETNSGAAAISPIATQFLAESFWYPTPNTPTAVRGADYAPFKLTVNLPTAQSSGLEKPGAGSVSFEQPLSAQLFFVQGDWDRIEGAGDAKNVVAFAPKGSGTEERKSAEGLIALAAAARSYFAGILGPAPDVPVKLISVRRGAGSNDAGAILFDAGVLRLPRVDAVTALSISEGVSRLWLGGQTNLRGEGSGALRDALVRYFATLFLEKQYGREAVQSELYRQRVAYAAVARRDGPLSRSNKFDDTYYGSVPNRGAMVWRLVEQRLGREVFHGLVRTALQSAKTDGLTLAAFRSSLVEKGGESLKQLLDTQLDQLIDTDLMVGVPQQRGADWVSALRNLGSIDVRVNVLATTDRGEQLKTEVSVPSKNFGEAVFKTTSKIVRVEVDPEKSYPQLDYGNDVVPRSKDLPDALNEATLQLGAQDFAKAEATSREMLNYAPRFQQARILLARALLGQGKLDEAEKLFRSALDEVLPFTETLAWANIGLGEISMQRGQAAEAAKRFNDAVIASRDYPSSLAARAARLRAEAAANNAPPVDDSARTFITQFSQALVANKRADLETRVISGELVRFMNASIGTEIWEAKVVRTEMLNPNLLAADVQIRVNKLGKEGSGTALFLLARVAGGWKLSGIEQFEVK
jgi:hypothetical protein